VAAAFVHTITTQGRYTHAWVKLTTCHLTDSAAANHALRQLEQTRSTAELPEAASLAAYTNHTPRRCCTRQSIGCA
jgi:hypothetical protein